MAKNSVPREKRNQPDLVELLDVVMTYDEFLRDLKHARVWAAEQITAADKLEQSGDAIFPILWENTVWHEANDFMLRRYPGLIAFAAKCDGSSAANPEYALTEADPVTNVESLKSVIQDLVIQGTGVFPEIREWYGAPPMVHAATCFATLDVLSIEALIASLPHSGETSLVPLRTEVRLSAVTWNGGNFILDNKILDGHYQGILVVFEPHANAGDILAAVQAQIPFTAHGEPSITKKRKGGSLAAAKLFELYSLWRAQSPSTTPNYFADSIAAGGLQQQVRKIWEARPHKSTVTKRLTWARRVFSPTPDVELNPLDIQLYRNE